MPLDSAVSEMKRQSKSSARRLAKLGDVSQEVASLNERKEVTMQWVVGAMVAREKTLRRPRKHYAKAIAALVDPAFVTWHKTRIIWIKRLEIGF